jgi:hypothetical protein
MPFVKLDTRILDSSLWCDCDQTRVFLTVLCMAEPHELTAHSEVIDADMKPAGWFIPPGWYGLAPVSSAGIIARSMLPRDDARRALLKLTEPDPESRGRDFDGRRLARIDGGWIVLNYMAYRDRDYTGAERARRYRERVSSRRDVTAVTPASPCNVTQAEAEAEAEGENLLPETSSSPSALEAGVTGFALTPSEPPKDAKRERRKALGHFVPEDFAVRGSDADWARAEFPAVDLFTETQKFRDHEFDKPRSDWHRAWRNWVRKAAETKGARRG